MRVDFERHAADLHGQVLSTSDRPIHSTVGCFHLDTVLRVDASANFFGEVAAYNYDLRSWVENPVFGAEIAD